MPDALNISADYTLRPSELAATLEVLIEAKQPVMVWGPPGCAKSEVAQQVAATTNRIYFDVRGLLLDPVDLRGIPWRDDDNITRWAHPEFLPPTDSTALYLVNLEELPSCVPMMQASMYQLVRDRKCGEYTLPEGASIMACGNRQADRGVTLRDHSPCATARRRQRNATQRQPGRMQPCFFVSRPPRARPRPTRCGTRPAARLRRTAPQPLAAPKSASHACPAEHQ